MTKHAAILDKTAQKSSPSHGSSNAAGSSGVSQTPPAYGIDFADSAPIQKISAAKEPSAGAQAASTNGQPHTGLPDNLKTGIENLSGYAMDDVIVHYNSGKPAQLQAHAYAQGTDIHLAPGQERHLPHEAWHVVQQKQGRVKPTLQMKGKMNINDDVALEKEADVMGRKALQLHSTREQTNTPYQLKGMELGIGPVVQRVRLAKDRLNVIGENHDESGGQRRNQEDGVCTEVTGGGYWEEGEFTVNVGGQQTTADPSHYRFLATLRNIDQLLGGAFTNYTYADSIVNFTQRPTIPILIQVARQKWAETEDVPYPGPLTPGQLTTRDADLDDRYQELRRLERAFLAIRGMAGQRLDRTARALVFQRRRDVIAAKNAMINGLPPLEDIRLLRSEAMHRAAQANSRTRGVWKIGQDHVTDIQNNLPGWGQPNYRLITQDEFNIEFARLTRPKRSFMSFIRFI